MGIGALLLNAGLLISSAAAGTAIAIAAAPHTTANQVFRIVSLL